MGIFDNDKYTENIVARHTYWTTFIHPSQAYLGRTYIALNREGKLDPYQDTTPAEAKELKQILGTMRTVINKLYQPDKFDQAVFANEWHHCHLHLIPRYKTSCSVEGVVFTDSNWGGNYAPYNKDFTIPPETFSTIRDAMKRELRTFD